MIIDFSVENFKSIKEEQTLSMTAVNLRNEHPDRVFSYDKNISLVRTAAIYGSNASGKSNLLEALRIFKDFILDSTDLKVEDSIPYYNPYKLDKNYLNKPTKFEIAFIGNAKIRYKYNISFNDKEVIEEKLVFYPKKQEALLFEREKGGNIIFGSQLKGKKKNIGSQLLRNNLFLSKAANSNHEQLGIIYKYFLYNLNSDSFLKRKIYLSKTIFEREIYLRTTALLAKKDNFSFKNKLIDFLIASDTGILSVEIKKDEEYDAVKPVTYHKLFEDKKEIGVTEFELSEESDGTKKMYNLAGVIIYVLKNGYTLILDELDSSLHPLLSEYLIELFNSPEKNPNNAQFIFTTHDTSVLKPELFRRDQIWFTRKNSYGATELFSLDEFDKDLVRKNTPFEEWYLSGRFGAVPKINKNLFNIEKRDKKIDNEE